MAPTEKLGALQMLRVRVWLAGVRFFGARRVLPPRRLAGLLLDRLA
jgi:hypothetical protein